MASEAFVHPIKLGKRLDNGQVGNPGEVHVVCVESTDPYLAVHASGDRIKDFVVTHLPTGYWILRGFPDTRTALLAAGVLSEVIDWSREWKTIHRRYEALPPRVREWMDLWRWPWGVGKEPS